MIGILSLVSPPASEPMGLDELKAHLRVAGTTDDGEIVGMLIAAREAAEAYLNRALVTQTWDWWLPGFPLPDFPERRLVLPKPPLQSVTSVKYIDAAGAEQTYATGNYVVVAPAGPRAPAGWIERDEDASWPDLDAREDAVRIRFVAGWTGPEKIPDGIRNGIKLIALHLYEHRGDRQEAGIANAEPRMLPPTAEHLMFPYRIF